MANIINGNFSLKDVLQLTFQSEFKNRYEYKERDVLKSISIQSIKTLKPDRPNEPTVTYRIISSSYPQYYPYFTKTDSRGRHHTYQRKFKHEYEVVLSMDRLSINTKAWKIRLGSLAKWEENPPANMLKSVSLADRDSIKKNLERKYKDKTKSFINEEYKKEIEKRKNQGKYLNVGDYNIEVKKINPDFYFRCMVVYDRNNHLYNKDTTNHALPVVTNPSNIMFFPKHVINLLDVLMKKGILKDN